ncbi:protein FAM83F [Mastacembelus armatus]|uniref:Family with sequence similarity 83 member Fb n=1 Tax=Mastacembelus armatus TaxID=205130 RepID=A0A3Q3KZY6_9TELE|nr:protein FAM83F-like [Mastacembelus armatus]XP_026158239.1 protein FAM83F-like [Mastacembelus armatus]
MAESQLTCMEDGHIGVKVPESKPEFYYSEEQRVAIEELLKNGDGAFKTRLKEDDMKDFLSAREIKVLTNTFRLYDSADDSGKATPPSVQGPSRNDADSGVHSTYWPQMSDTEVPQLDNGWPSGGLFRGVTRVAVHTHPPKDNGPHIKEVVRRLIQEATKVIAIVMDMLTDLQILQDLIDAAWRRSVPVYILLDNHGVPHFLDMCTRLQINSQHLRNIRARALQGVGFGLSFGRLPGSLCNKYMLVDGDKVVFGSYSFSWSTSRMDRNMITVMTGQVVDFFDRDFRELYAISEKLDLYKEFHVSPPAANAAATIRSKSAPKRPPLPATTSRFQVSLGDSQNPGIQVPAHKYYNPKYLLMLGELPRPTGSLQEPGPMRGSAVPQEMDQGRPQMTSSEKLERLSPLPSEAVNESFKRHNGVKQDKKHRFSKFFKGKSSSKLSDNCLAKSTCPSPTETNRTDENEDSFEVVVISPSKQTGKKSSKLGQRTESAQDNESVKGRRKAQPQCKVS